MNLPGVASSAAEPGDYDGDGLMDILLAGTAMAGTNICQLWRNTGNGFSNVNVGLPGMNDCKIPWGDFDNDGRLDILLASGSLMQLWRNTGNGFTNINAGFVPIGYRFAAVWGDYNNDGRSDIAVAGSAGFSTERPHGLHIWRNTGTGFDFLTVASEESQYSSVLWGDYDNDGHSDLLRAGRVSLNVPTRQLWRNAIGAFANMPISLPGLCAGSLAYGDYDRDSRLDLAIVGKFDEQTSASELWHHTGEGFSKTNVGLPPIGGMSPPASAFWGDYDNDGRPDLLLYGLNADNRPRMDPEFLCQIWRNTGAGFTNINAGLPALWEGSAGWIDYDNDGRLDVLLTGRDYWSGQRRTEIYRNILVPANSPPTAPSGLRVFQTPFGVAFTWLAASDAQTPSSGLSYNLRIGSAPGQCDIVAPNSLPDGKRLLLQIGNAQMRRFAYLIGLTNGQTVYWTVQAIDTAFAGGQFAPEQTFVYPPPDAWSAPTLSFKRLAPNGSMRLGFTSSLPLPFSLFTSTNLVHWQRLGDMRETVGNSYEAIFEPENSLRFFKFRSP